MKNWNYINGAEVGNETKVNPVDPSPKTGSKPNPDNNQNPKKNPKKEMTDKNGRTFREVLEEVKKTGNARYTSRADVISHLDTDLYDICKKVPAGSPSFAYVSELQKTGWDIGTISKYTKEIGKIIDKYAKVGNSTEKLFEGLKKDADKVEEKGEKEVDKLKEVENSVVKTIKDFEIDIEKRPGENYWRWYVDHKNGDNLDSGFENSKEEAIRAAERKINSGDFRSPIRNNKTGNYKTGTSKLKPGDKVESYGVKGVVKSIKGENEDNIYGEPLIEVEFNSGVKKVVPEHYLIKVGNSSSDDKFAYVMREFDEGKLKTPDGKVVTDPAQAKAIAYSESKKTENGLARARNAMNKKCGNSQITLWKGNNSALVSDDGLVQYLENNAFETDRDKYDSQQTAIEELKKLGYRKK